MLVERPNLASVSGRTPTHTIVKGLLMINGREVIIPLNPIAEALHFL